MTVVLVGDHSSAISRPFDSYYMSATIFVLTSYFLLLASKNAKFSQIPKNKVAAGFILDRFDFLPLTDIIQYYVGQSLSQDGGDLKRIQ